MIIEIATAAWFCFANGICYDQATVEVQGPEVATVVTDGDRTAAMIINCRTKIHRVMAGEESIEGSFEPHSVAAIICEKYLPES